jgi:hypothetical protein
MPESLEDVKNRLRQSFLGKAGIHGVGVSRARQAIQVYLSPDAGTDQTDLLEQLRKSAAPFPVIVIREDRPRIGEPGEAGA